MTDTELAGFAEMYDGYGAVAREAAIAVDALRAALEVAQLENVPGLVREALRRVERVHAIAAAERERWA